jgi:hypothetical protein
MPSRAFIFVRVVLSHSLCSSCFKCDVRTYVLSLHCRSHVVVHLCGFVYYVTHFPSHCPCTVSLDRLALEAMGSTVCTLRMFRALRMCADSFGCSFGKTL